jgi:hypothetical protein
MRIGFGRSSNDGIGIGVLSARVAFDVGIEHLPGPSPDQSMPQTPDQGMLRRRSAVSHPEMLRADADGSDGSNSLPDAAMRLAPRHRLGLLPSSSLADQRSASVSRRRPFRVRSRLAPRCCCSGRLFRDATGDVRDEHHHCSTMRTGVQTHRSPSVNPGSQHLPLRVQAS